MYILLDDNADHDVFIEPPKVCDRTDEDSGDENIDGITNPEKLTGRQLSAPAELRPRNRDSDYDPQEVLTHDPAPRTETKSKNKRTKINAKITSQICTSSGLKTLLPEGNYTQYSNLDPVD